MTHTFKSQSPISFFHYKEVKISSLGEFKTQTDINMEQCVQHLLKNPENQLRNEPSVIDFIENPYEIDRSIPDPRVI